MKGKFWLTLVTGLFVLSLLLVPGLFPQPVGAQAPAGDFVPGELIVGFRAGVVEAAAQATLSEALAKSGGIIKKSPANLRNLLPAEEQAALARAPMAFLITVKDTSPKGMAKAASQLKALRGVQFVEPNGIARIPEPQPGEKPAPIQIKPEFLTNDPMLIHQWGYFNINAHLSPPPPSKAPAIAIIDTGVDYNHPELPLGRKVIKGPDLVNGDNDPMDDHGHGTHCAGIAAAMTNNNIGIAGISPGSKVYAVKVLSAQGWGTWYDVAQGIIAAAVRTDVKVLSLSLGGGASTAVETAVNFAWAKGKVVCAAAGNDNTNILFYPAAYTNAIAVAAHQYDDWKAWFSNWCDWVDISAPGYKILSTLPMSLYPIGYGVWSGTSMATPFVAGAAARVWAQNSGWNNAQVRNQLETTARPVPLDSIGDPIIDGDPDPPDDNWNSWPAPPEVTCCTTFTDADRPWLLNLHAALGGTLEGAETGIYGVVFDAITGNPLVGAKVTVTRTSPATPAFSRFDFVMVTGEFLIVNLLPGTYKLTITKKGYATPILTGIVVSSITNVGLIPVAQTGPKWVVAVTWPGFGTDNDFFGWLPPATPYVLSYGNVGAMTAFPWARWNYDSWVGIPMQSISLKKTLAGVYNLGLYTYEGDDYLRASGAVAWVYRGTTLVTILPITNTGSGVWWHIGRISGTTFTAINTIGDYLPGPYGSVTGVNPQGRIEVSPRELPQELPRIPEKEPVPPKR